jgi:hypothetical protein
MKTSTIVKFLKDFPRERIYKGQEGKITHIYTDGGVVVEVIQLGTSRFVVVNDPTELEEVDLKNLTLRESIARKPFELLCELYAQSLEDWANTDTEIRKLAAEVLSQEYVDGDSFFVPCTEDIVGHLVGTIKLLKLKLEGSGQSEKAAV